MVVLVPTPPDLRRGQSCWRRTGLQERRSGAPKRSEGGLNSSGLPHLEKSPLLPATILFRWVNGEISGIPRTRTSSQLRSLGLILFSHHQSKEPTKSKRDIKKQKRHETLNFTPQHPRRCRLSCRRGGLHYPRARAVVDCRCADRELPHIRRLQDQDAFYTQAARTLQDADTKQNHDEASQREDLLRLCRSGAKPALHW